MNAAVSWLSDLASDGYYESKEVKRAWYLDMLSYIVGLLLSSFDFWSEFQISSYAEVLFQSNFYLQASKIYCT